MKIEVCNVHTWETVFSFQADIIDSKSGSTKMDGKTAKMLAISTAFDNDIEWDDEAFLACW